MKFSAHLSATYLLPLVVLVLSFGACVWTISRNDRVYQKYIEEIDRRQNLLMLIKQDLGYGGGIHSFKNYILRHDDQYKEAAVESFSHSLGLIDRYLASEDLYQVERTALVAIRATVEDYLGMIPIAARLITNGADIPIIDQKVRIDDTAAIAGFLEIEKSFLKKRQQSLDELQAQNSLSLWSNGILLLLILLVTLLNVILLRRRMSLNLKAFVDFAQDVGAGSYTSEIQTPPNVPQWDEFRKLGNHLLAMAAKIDHAMKGQKVLEESLRKSNRELSEQNLRIEQFSHVAAHDLREPVRRIQYASIALREDAADKLSGDEKFFLESLGEQAEKLLCLIDDLRNITRVGQGKTSDVVNIGTDGLIRSILEGFGDTISQRQVSVSLGPLPEISGYQSLVELLFRNVLTNILRHTAGAINIDIYFANDLFVLKNTGAQPLETPLESLFLPFVKSTKSSGSGLGLYTCQLIMEAHKGSIWAEFDGTHGVFTIKLKFGS